MAKIVKFDIRTGTITSLEALALIKLNFPNKAETISQTTANKRNGVVYFGKYVLMVAGLNQTKIRNEIEIINRSIRKKTNCLLNPLFLTELLFFITINALAKLRIILDLHRNQIKVSLCTSCFSKNNIKKRFKEIF